MTPDQVFAAAILGLFVLGLIVAIAAVATFAAKRGAK